MIYTVSLCSAASIRKTKTIPTSASTAKLAACIGTRKKKHPSAAIAAFLQPKHDKADLLIDWTAGWITEDLVISPREKHDRRESFASGNAWHDDSQMM
jgi:hypothetical protein